MSCCIFLRRNIIYIYPLKISIFLLVFFATQITTLSVKNYTQGKFLNKNSTFITKRILEIHNEALPAYANSMDYIRDHDDEALFNVSLHMHTSFQLYSSKSVDAPQPIFPCDAQGNCSKYSSSMPLVCIDGLCECYVPLCWIYTYDNARFIPRYEFTCGECGQLGSQCQRDDPSTCDYPGQCKGDAFCHCPEGEHSEDICFVENGSAILQFLIVGLIVFLFLAAAAVLYQTILSYRQHRRIWWCRRYRGRRRGNRRQSRARGSNRCEKSPAYTSQQLMMQNFNDEEDTSEYESDYSDKDSVEVSVKSRASSVSTMNQKDKSITSNESATCLDTIYLKEMATTPTRDETDSENLKNQRDVNAATYINESFVPEDIKSDIYILPVSDSSGMTEYFNQHDENLTNNS